MKYLITLFSALLISALSLNATAAERPSMPSSPKAHLLFVEKSKTGEITALKQKGEYQVRLDAPGDISWFTDVPYHEYGSWTPEQFNNMTHRNHFMKKHPNFALLYDTTENGKKQVVFFKIKDIRYQSKPKSTLFLTGNVLKAKHKQALYTGKIQDVSVFVDSYLCFDGNCY